MLVSPRTFALRPPGEPPLVEDAAAEVARDMSGLRIGVKERKFEAWALDASALGAGET